MNTRLLGGGIAAVLLTAGAAHAAPLPQAPQFGSQQIITQQAQGLLDIEAVDIDGDGDMDVLAASPVNDRIALHRNNGNGTFTQIIIDNNLDFATSVLAADIDGDGDLDIVATSGSFSSSNARIVWYRRNANGTYSGQNMIMSGVVSAIDVEAGDIDGDGDLDLVLALNLFDQIGWFRNNGNGTFQSVISIDSGNADAVRDLHLADVDSDGDLDVMACNYNDNRVNWYRQNNNGSFSKLTFTTQTQGPRMVRTGDINGDGNLDVITTSVLDRKVAWYAGNGTATYGSQQVISTQDQDARGLEVADLDGDGDLDILTTSEVVNNVDFFLNNGTGSFGAQNVITTQANGANAVVAADIDGDGDLDVVSGSPDDNKVAWYTQLGSPSFGTNYCNAADNSTGVSGVISATGSLSIADNDLTLIATDLPDSQFGMFICSATQASIPVSAGILCVTGQIGRFNAPGQIQNSGQGGEIELSVDLTANWPVVGVINIAPGETWHFSTWFRDIGQTSNFTNGLSLTFQ